MIARGPAADAYLWSQFKARPEGCEARVIDSSDFAEMQPSRAKSALLDELFEECRRRGVFKVRGCPSEAIPMWLPLDTAKAPQLTEALAQGASNSTGWRFQGVEIF